MTCTVVQSPGGLAIVCTRTQRPRCACGAVAPLRCDWKVPSRKTGTCDAKLCEGCATQPAPGKDLCPEHARAWAAWQAARSPRASSPAAVVDGR